MNAKSSNLRVLLSSPAPTVLTNPYTVLLKESLDEQPGIHAEYFSWRTALTGDFDVFHSHWPEIMVSGRTPARTVVRQARTMAFLTRLRSRRIPVVRTVHNVGLPDGLSRREVAMLRLVDRLTTVRIVLNPTTPVPTGSATALIPHGHYIDWFDGAVTPSRVPGRVAYVGRIRRYKGVEALLRAFRSIDEDSSPGLSLTVSGFPSTAQLAADLEAVASEDDRVTLKFGMLSDSDLVDSVGQAELVVLPYPQMHNSGAVFTALSLGRPVLVPRNPINEALADEVGRDWVQMFTDDLTAEAMTSALASVRATPPRSLPDLSARDWESSARAHGDAYRRAVAISSEHSQRS